MAVAEITLCMRDLPGNPIRALILIIKMLNSLNASKHLLLELCYACIMSYLGIKKQAV